MIKGEGTGRNGNPSGVGEEGTESGGVIFSRAPKASVHLTAPSAGQDRWFANGRDQSKSGSGLNKDRPGLCNRQASYANDDTSFLSDLDKDDQCFASLEVPKAEKQHFGRNEQRTIVIKNLSDRTTHKDLVDVIRGGALLDIYLRSHDRTASVSFLEGAAAQEFFNHAKRNDIYIHGKRVSSSYSFQPPRCPNVMQVEICWNDRQFILPGHVANKVGIGATRNLIIRNVHPNLTAQRLRDDLDHIHNLVVIDITNQDGHMYISLNSVHNALFARTCMMSRATYKGMKIEWYPDECAQPLPKVQKVQHVPKKENYLAPAKKTNTMVNRFQMLNMDGTEDGSEDDDTDGLDNYAPISHGTKWAAPGIAA